MKQAKLHNRAKGAVISSSILHEPFCALLPLLPFILLKEMNASTLHITVLAMLKPIMSLLSFFYSSYLLKFNFSLKANLLLTGLLARTPFILALYSNEPWIYIFACSMYMLFSRASIVPWMELLRLNLPQTVLQRVFSFSSMLAYAVGIAFALCLGFLLDRHTGFWKIAFFWFLSIGLVAVVLQICLLEVKGNYVEISNMKVQPIKQMISLLKNRPDFLRFQYVFMAGGLGLMLLSPALPVYFCQDLNINYKELLFIFAVCKAVGFVLASPFWRNYLNISTINEFSKSVLGGFLLYTLILYLAKFNLSLIFLAYIVYGVFQAASHLVWHMSAPLFSSNKDSCIFSSVNVFTVGLRGCIAPFLGSYLLLHFGMNSVFLASAFCFIFGIVFTQSAKIYKQSVN